MDGGVADRSIGLLGIIHHYIISLADVAAPSTVQDDPEVQQMLLQATPPTGVCVCIYPNVMLILLTTKDPLSHRRRRH